MRKSLRGLEGKTTDRHKEQSARQVANKKEWPWDPWDETEGNSGWQWLSEVG